MLHYHSEAMFAVRVRESTFRELIAQKVTVDIAIQTGGIRRYKGYQADIEAFFGLLVGPAPYTFRT